MSAAALKGLLERIQGSTSLLVLLGLSVALALVLGRFWYVFIVRGGMRRALAGRRIVLLALTSVLVETVAVFFFCGAGLRFPFYVGAFLLVMLALLLADLLGERVRARRAALRYF
ncbi:MAG: hypothetical protein AAF447_16145 [Myxococcota bacterium]